LHIREEVVPVDNILGYIFNRILEVEPVCVAVNALVLPLDELNRVAVVAEESLAFR
jgi:hypothetical protein